MSRSVTGLVLVAVVFASGCDDAAGEEAGPEAASTEDRATIAMLLEAPDGQAYVAVRSHWTGVHVQRVSQRGVEASASMPSPHDINYAGGVLWADDGALVFHAPFESANGFHSVSPERGAAPLNMRPVIDPRKDPVTATVAEAPRAANGARYFVWQGSAPALFEWDAPSDTWKVKWVASQPAGRAVGVDDEGNTYTSDDTETAETVRGGLGTRRTTAAPLLETTVRAIDPAGAERWTARLPLSLRENGDQGSAAAAGASGMWIAAHERLVHYAPSGGVEADVVLPRGERGVAVALDKEGAVVVATRTRVLHYGARGALDWEREVAIDGKAVELSRVVVASDGDVLVAGSVRTNRLDAAVIRLDRASAVRWQTVGCGCLDLKR